MNPMGQQHWTTQMSQQAPTAQDPESIYQMRLAKIQAMPDGPEKLAAEQQLVADYQGRTNAATTQQQQGYEMATAGSPQGTQLGGKYSTYVAANPLEHLASGLRQYKGYKDMRESKKALEGLSGQKEDAMTRLIQAMTRR